MTARKPVAATDIDYDLAMLSEPLDGDQLDALSAIISARDTITELQALIGQMQTRLESGAAPYPLREQYAIDLDELSDRLHLHLTGLLS